MKKNLLLFIFFFTSATISCFANLSVTLNVQNATCTNTNGYVSASVTGGVPPYTYLWSTSDTTATTQYIPAGTYTVTVTDSIGTTVTSSATVLPASMDISYSWDEWGNTYRA